MWYPWLLPKEYENGQVVATTDQQLENVDSTEVTVTRKELPGLHLDHTLCRVEREGGVTLSQDWRVGSVHLQSCATT